MKQAEKVMDELGNSRALLEIQYENEVSLVETHFLVNDFDKRYRQM